MAYVPPTSPALHRYSISAAVALEVVQRWFRGQEPFPEWSSGALLPGDDLLRAFDYIIARYATRMRKPSDAAGLRQLWARERRKAEKVFGGKLVQL